MTFSDDERQQLDAKISEAFSPAAPINEYSLFAGRIDQVREIIAAVNQRGQHVILFGERGVGKTSLANVLSDVVGTLKKNFVVSKINCNVKDDYSSIWGKVLRQMRVFRPKRGAGFVARTTAEPVDLVELLGGQVFPDNVQHVLSLLQPHALVIIDEFDRIRTPDTRTLLTDTIKTFSDYSADATIILVGVADSVDELIRGHQSVDRALVQVRLPRMSRNELNEIVNKGLQSIQMEITSDALEYISSLSQGLPHYTHLLAQLSAYRAVDSERKEIQKQDVDGAIKDALSKVQQSILSLYHRATMSVRETLYAQVLLACALSKVDALGYFAASDVREPMSKIMRKRYDIPAFSRHLNDFCEPTRGPILQKIGTRRKFRFRFLNPLMQPYVIMQGLSSQLIDETFISGYRPPVVKKGYRPSF